ncbi:MAG TPA: hypothetical protein VHH34_00745, partial [Pseudonocardiaceae bacterium]|nr:hypothetical protein [Pseudonocardiaceae bacterium]
MFTLPLPATFTVSERYSSRYPAVRTDEASCHRLVTIRTGDVASLALLPTVLDDGERARRPGLLAGRMRVRGAEVAAASWQGGQLSMQRQWSLRRSEVLRVAALVAGATLVLSACGTGGGGEDEGARTGTVFADCDQNPNTCNSAASSELQQGGQISYAIEKNIPNWNLISSEGNTFETGQVLRAVLPATFYTQPDLTTAMNENLLESAEVTRT